jgi:hypothetical protein
MASLDGSTDTEAGAGTLGAATVIGLIGVTGSGIVLNGWVFFICTDPAGLEGGSGNTVMRAVSFFGPGPEEIPRWGTMDGGGGGGAIFGSNGTGAAAAEPASGGDLVAKEGGGGTALEGAGGTGA